VEEGELLPALDDMTPREIVVSWINILSDRRQRSAPWRWLLRNRVRRQKLPPEIAEDVLPKIFDDRAHRRG